MSHPILPSAYVIQSNLSWIDWRIFPSLPLVLVHHHGPLPPCQLLHFLQSFPPPPPQLLVDLLHGGAHPLPLPLRHPCPHRLHRQLPHPQFRDHHRPHRCLLTCSVSNGGLTL